LGLRELSKIEIRLLQRKGNVDPCWLPPLDSVMVRMKKCVRSLETTLASMYIQYVPVSRTYPKTTSAWYFVSFHSNIYSPRSRIGRQLLVIVPCPHHLLCGRVRPRQLYYCPSCFGFTIPRASAVSFISDHSGRGISTPSAKRPYVMPPSLLMGRRICGSRACQHRQQEDGKERAERSQA
jgi:hypothetical protein